MRKDTLLGYANFDPLKHRISLGDRLAFQKVWYLARDSEMEALFAIQDYIQDIDNEYGLETAINMIQILVANRHNDEDDLRNLNVMYEVFDDDLENFLRRMD